MRRKKLDKLIAESLVKLENLERYKEFCDDIRHVIEIAVKDFWATTEMTPAEIYEEISYPSLKNIALYAKSLTGLMVEEGILDSNKLSEEDKMYIADQVAVYWVEVRKNLCKEVLKLKKRGGN